MAAPDAKGSGRPGVRGPCPVAVITVRGEDGRQLPRRILSRDGDFDVEILAAPRLSRVGRTFHYLYLVEGDGRRYVLDLNLDTWSWMLAEAPAALRSTAAG